MQKPIKTLPHITRIILDSISDGVFTIDHNWEITSFNRSAEEITGVSASQAIGRKCWDVFHSNMCEGVCSLRRTMEEGVPLVNTQGYIVSIDQKKIPVITSTSLLKDETGKILGGVETFRDISLIENLRKEIDSGFQIGDMISRSNAMKKIFDILPQLSMSDSPILIQGETGTGKELLARAIHSISSRAKNKFIGINCGAFPDNLLESELFGYKAGAFTNASKNKPGYFQAAEGGTILLDEIGETTPAFQVKLLRLLEEKEIQPLGSVTPVKINVRILASTNKNLAEMVEQGTFRKDLFYRINIVQMALPPLRQRKEDIPLLIEKFIEKFNFVKSRSIKNISSHALSILMKHDYPGNIRELENIIEHAFILCQHEQISSEHLPENISPETKKVYPYSETKTLTEVIEKAEKDAIEKTLSQNSFNRSAAAKKLGLHKSTLFRKITKYKIDLPKTDGRSREANN